MSRGLANLLHQASVLATTNRINMMEGLTLRKKKSFALTTGPVVRFAMLGLMVSGLPRTFIPYLQGVEIASHLRRLPVT